MIMVYRNWRPWWRAWNTALRESSKWVLTSNPQCQLLAEFRISPLIPTRWRVFMKEPSTLREKKPREEVAIKHFEEIQTYVQFSWTATKHVLYALVWSRCRHNQQSNSYSPIPSHSSISMNPITQLHRGRNECPWLENQSKYAYHQL